MRESGGSISAVIHGFRQRIVMRARVYCIQEIDSIEIRGEFIYLLLIPST